MEKKWKKLDPLDRGRAKQIESLVREQCNKLKSVFNRI
jgi:hypothetical protein